MLTYESDNVSLKLLWRSTAKTRLSYNVAVHLIDDGGNILQQYDYPQDVTRGIIDKGTIWVDTVNFPALAWNKAEAAAIALYSRSDGTLPVDKGIRDWNGKRVVVMKHLPKVRK